MSYAGARTEDPRKVIRASSTCQDRECVGMKEVRFEEDIVLALHQMRSSREWPYRPLQLGAYR